MVNGEDLVAIIGGIYDCALDPTGWPDVLTQITETIGGAYTNISLVDSQSNQGRLVVSSPWDQEQLRILHDDFSVEEIRPVLDVINGDIDTPLTTLTTISEAEFQTSNFFKKWANPQNLRDSCIMKYVHTADRIGLVGCIVSANRDIISPTERNFFARLSPHLRRASMIGDLLDQARLNASLFRATLDNLAVAVVLTDAAGKILYSNSKADGLLVQEAPIYSKQGYLYVQNKLANTALLKAIAGAAGPEIDLGNRGIGLPISGRDDAPAVAYVLPLSNRTLRADFTPACAAIFISMTTSARPLPEAVLTSLFDLTPGEARVFALISSGLTSAQTATRLNISENTVKTHLTRIYSKTNTMRQSDLVRLNSAIGAPLRLP